MSHHEVCAVTPSRSLTPYNSEYEGYMGNYGNTVDRWYRRAAVVVWPEERSFAARAEAGSAWALRTLLGQIGAGDVESARADAMSLEPFWLHVEAAALSPALRVAAGLVDPEAAKVVLAPFRLEMLTTDDAPLLVALAVRYGDQWVRGLLDIWESRHRFGGTERSAWVGETLLPLCVALRAHEAGRLADVVTDRVWGWLSGRIDACVGTDHADRRRAGLVALGEPLARLLEAASDERGATIAEALRAEPDPVVDLLVAALREHRPPATTAVRSVVRDCRERLTRRVEAPARADDDWSIAWTGCGCEVCTRLGRFLASPVDRTEEWPLAKAGRQHVHGQIDGAGLPVRHTTGDRGGPSPSSWRRPTTSSGASSPPAARPWPIWPGSTRSTVGATAPRQFGPRPVISPNYVTGYTNYERIRTGRSSSWIGNHRSSSTRTCQRRLSAAWWRVAF